MAQADGYIRISTLNDTTQAQRSTEQLGDTLANALDTSPADRVTDAVTNLGNALRDTDGSATGLGDVQHGIDDVGNSAITTGQLIRANLISDTVMKGVQQLGSALENTAISAVSGAMSNETAFAKASTLLSGNDLEKFFEGLIDISNRTGVAFADLAESMYSALSAGVDQENVLEFVENSVKLSKGGFTQTATAIDIVTTALNAYDMEMEDATHIQDVLITTQNKGKTTVDELAGSMGKIIPTAKSVNVEFDQLGAMFATVTANGVATAEATTYLNGMIDELGSSGSTAEKALMAATEGTALAGKKFSEISAMGYDVTDVLKLMSDEAAKSGQSLADMFSSSEASKAANILLSNIDGFKQNIEAMADSTGAAATAADTMMDTTAEKVQVAKNQIDNLTTSIAQSLLPVIGEAAEEISEALDESNIKKTAKDIGEFVSGTLSVLLKNIKLIGSAVAGVTSGVVAFKAANVLTKVISSWQSAALQVKLFAAAQGSAALQAAATNGTLTTQEIVYAALSGKLDAATLKTLKLNAAMSANPAGAVAAVVGLLAAALTGFVLNADSAASAASEYADAVNDIRNSLEQAQDRMEETISKGEAEMAMLKDKASRYEELRTAVDLTAEEEAELKGLALDLQDILGENVTVINALTGEYNNLADAVDAYVQKQMAAVKLSAYDDMLKDAYTAIIDAENTISELENMYGAEALSSAPRDMADGTIMGVSVGETARGLAQAAVAWDDANSIIEDAQKKIDTYMDSYYDLFSDANNEISFSFTAAGDSSSLTDDVKAHYAAIAEKNLETYKSNLADMDYYLKMGYITNDEYYSKLEAMRDKYLERDTEEWRSVNVEIKKYYDSLSEEQKKAYEQQLKQQKEAAEQAQRERLASYNEEKSQLQFQQKTGQISEKQYYEALAKIRDKYLDKNSAEWRNSFLETYQYNQKIIEANKDALNALLTETSDSTLSALQNIISARDSLTSKLMDFNKTFEKITETVPETVAVKGEFTVTTAEHEIETYRMGADSIEDNIKILEEYGEMLDALKARGADDGTLNDILAMDVDEAMEFGSKMLKMTDREWNGYFDSMARLRETAADISAKYYQSEVDSLKNNFVDRLREELFGLDSDMMSIGAEAAMSFISGWNEAIGANDLTLGDMLYSLAGGSYTTAPKMAQLLSGFGATIGSSEKVKTDSGTTVMPIYIGGEKLTDIVIEGINSKNIKVGKNVLNT